MHKLLMLKDFERERLYVIIVKFLQNFPDYIIMKLLRRNRDFIRKNAAFQLAFPKQLGIHAIKRKSSSSYIPVPVIVIHGMGYH